MVLAGFRAEGSLSGHTFISFQVSSPILVHSVPRFGVPDLLSLSYSSDYFDYLKNKWVQPIIWLYSIHFSVSLQIGIKHAHTHTSENKNIYIIHHTEVILLKLFFYIYRSLVKQKNLTVNYSLGLCTDHFAIYRHFWELLISTVDYYCCCCCVCSSFDECVRLVTWDTKAQVFPRDWILMLWTERRSLWVGPAGKLLVLRKLVKE